MPSLQRLIITSDGTTADFQSRCDLAPGQLPATNNFINYISGLCGGNSSALLAFKVGAAQATATVTSTGTAANNETMLLCNSTLTAKTSGAVPASGEFNISAVVATQATSIALAINSVVLLQGTVSATSALGVVTITSLVPGLVGNGLQISEALGNVTNTAFSGGLDGTTYNIDLR